MLGTETGIRAAGTVALLRDGEHGLETLLLRRPSSMAFQAGAWVFPGGAVDDDDLAAVVPTDDALQRAESAARIAGVRELAEEVGVTVDPGGLVLLSHWTTSPGRPRRFSTWFFLATTAAEHLTLAQHEVAAARWLTPAAALADHVVRQLRLAPPTFVTLTFLNQFSSAREAMAAAEAQGVEVVVPRPYPDGVLLPGDAGFETADPSQAGPRHRLIVRDEAWVYVMQGRDLPTAD